MQILFECVGGFFFLSFFSPYLEKKAKLRKAHK